MDIRQLARRHDIPRFAESIGLRGYAVEVGVATGAFSEAILDNWTTCKRLTMVDSWRHKKGHDFGWNFDNDKFQKMYLDCVKLMAKYGDRAVFHRDWSLQAAAVMPDHYFDLIFIDASHFYHDVAADLEAWFPKLTPGGVFSGHDYVEDCPSIGVKRAVHEFAARRGLKVYFTLDDGRTDNPSWVIYPAGENK